MQATPVTPTFTPVLAAGVMHLIEAGGKALGAQAWPTAIEALQSIQQAMQAADAQDRQRLADLEAAAAAPKEPQK